MSTLLGRDPAAIVAARTSGRLRALSFVRTTNTGVDTEDPAGPPTQSTATYEAEGISFGYDVRLVDGERVQVGDYRVMIPIGSISAAVDDSVTASLDLGAVTDNVDTVLEAIASGVDGNDITVELVGDAVTQAGTISEVGTNVRIGFLPDTTTIADLELLVMASTLVQVLSAGTGANVMDVNDELASELLSGGVNASTVQAPGVLPAVDDTISACPPGQTVQRSGRIVQVGPVTEAAVTVHVVGVGED